MGGRTFERKAHFETTSFKKAGWVYFSRVGLFSGDYGTSAVLKLGLTSHKGGSNHLPIGQSNR